MTSEEALEEQNKFLKSMKKSLRQARQGLIKPFDPDKH